jgi:outer membrane protein assembly factor BamA
LAITYVVGGQAPLHAQLTVPAIIPEAQIKPCLPSASSDYKQPSGHDIEIAELTFEGDLHMTIPDQDQIAATLKQRTYSGDPDGVTSEVLERVRRAWQGRGYLKVHVRSDTKVLTSNPVSDRIAVTVRVDEGQQYRLGGITFRNNRAISNVQVLRNLFPIADGDVLDREKIAKGLENLRRAYGSLGYINFTSLPNTDSDDENELVHLGIDVDEGKQFHVSSVNVLGLDGVVLQDGSKDLLLKPGDVYDPSLADLFLQQHASLLPTNALPDSLIQRRIDERAATVAVTFDFRPCPAER